MRQVLLFAHRWLGLTAGLIFSIAALTGGVLVYQAELDNLLSGPRLDVTPGMVDPSTIESSARRQSPDSHLLKVEWPTPEANVFLVRMTDGKRLQFLELDPGSGAVLHPRQLHILLRAIRGFHANLLIGWVGSLIVTYSTLATIVSLLLGLYLWWPGVRRFRRGFRIRLGRGVYALILDLHQTSGVIVLPLLLVMAGTGVLMGSSTLRGLAMPSWNVQWPQSSPAGQEALDIDLGTVVRVAQTATGGRPLVSVDYPTASNGVFEIWTKGTSEWRHGAATRLALDRHTGSLLARQDVSYNANMNDRLHFASIGGPVVRILYAAACFVGAGLLLTGFLIWQKRPRVHLTGTPKPLSERDPS